MREGAQHLKKGAQQPPRGEKGSRLRIGALHPEIPRIRMVKHQRRDARLGLHHVPFREVNPDLLGMEGAEQLALERVNRFTEPLRPRCSPYTICGLRHSLRSWYGYLVWQP